MSLSSTPQHAHALRLHSSNPCPGQTPFQSPCARYDSHRDQILRSGVRHQAGGDAGGGFEPGQRPEEEEEVFSYFSSACYSGFGDDEKVRGPLVLGLSWVGGRGCGFLH